VLVQPLPAWAWAAGVAVAASLEPVAVAAAAAEGGTAAAVVVVGAVELEGMAPCAYLIRSQCTKHEIYCSINATADHLDISTDRSCEMIHSPIPGIATRCGPGGAAAAAGLGGFKKAMALGTCVATFHSGNVSFHTNELPSIWRASQAAQRQKDCEM